MHEEMTIRSSCIFAFANGHWDGTSTMLTDTQHLQQRIQDLEQRLASFENLVNQCPEGFMVVDEDGNVQFVNATMEALFRYQGNLVGTSFGIPIASGNVRELDLVRPDGSIGVAEMNISLIEWNQQPSYLIMLRDVTEHRQAEEKLKESEALLNETQKLARVGGWELDLRTNELFWTEAVYDIHQVPSTYVPTLETSLTFFPPHDAKILQHALNQAIEHQVPYDLELEFVTATNNHLWVRSIGRAFSHNGTIIKLSGTIQDITERKYLEMLLEQRVIDRTEQLEASTRALYTQISERKQAEDALQMSEASLSMMLKQVPIVLWTTNIHLRIISLQGAGLQDFGLEASRYVGHTIAEIFRNRRDQTAPVEAHRRALLGESAGYEIEVGAHTLDVRVEPLRNRQQHIVGCLGLALDITERKQAETTLATEHATMEAMVIQRTHELRHERDRTRAILEALGEAVIVADMHGDIQYLNPAAGELTGLSRPAGLDNFWWQWQQADQASMIQQVKHTIRKGAIWRGETIIQRSDGTRYDAAITIAPLFEPDTPRHPIGFVSVQRDITPLKVAERLKDQFVSNVSHELRTPISLITLLIGSLEMLYARMDDVKRLEIVGDIRQHTRALNDLVSDVLEISRIDSGRLPTERQPINLTHLVQEELQHLRPLAEKKLHTFHQHGTEDMIVMGNDGQLRQVVRNLFNNAIKYTPTGGEIRCTCQMLCHQSCPVPPAPDTPDPDPWPGRNELPPGSWAAIRISDTGLGIKPEDIPYIFERFYRVQSQGDIPGTGLGLSIAWELVKLHAGYLNVTSTLHQGSHFALYLPLLEAPS